MPRWYVVRSNLASQNDDEPYEERQIWTISKDPERCGWETDSGYDGYGLTKKDADELANAANKLAELENP